MGDRLTPPHGGRLTVLLAQADRRARLREMAPRWPTWTLSPRQLCDLELLLTGAFSPLEGFHSRGDYEAVCAQMRLGNGTLWPIPVTLEVDNSAARQIEPGATLGLVDPEGVVLAALHVEDVFRPDRRAEAQAVYGTTRPEHPGVSQLLVSPPVLVGGRVEGLQLPVHYDFQALRQTPSELRAEFEALGWHRVVAFQTRNPLHRAHQELTRRAAMETAAGLLLHPVVGLTKPGDLDHYTRVRCYQALLHRYPPGTVKLALLQLAMRMAGPREAVWHAVIRKNYGCSHFVVGRDHAGPGRDANGRPFYEPYAAQVLVRQHEAELGIRMVPFRELVYVEELDAYLPEDEVPPGSRTLTLSGTELRRHLALGNPLPAWFTFPEVAAELQRRHPPRSRQGLTVFFTGLSGAGKSTLARILQARFLERGDRPVTLLDGDVVRQHLSSELGFSKEHRDLNIRRIGFVAAEITKNGGVALCAPIAPYDGTRRDVRAMVAAVGGFVLVHVATPLSVCEQRDRKGLYAKARAGLIPQFTGISDPYEAPADAEVVIDTTGRSPDESAEEILGYLARERYLEEPAGPARGSASDDRAA